MKRLLISALLLLSLPSITLAQQFVIRLYKPSSAYKISVQNADGVELSVLEVPKGIFLSILGSRMNEDIQNNSQAWTGTVTIRTQAQSYLRTNNTSYLRTNNTSVSTQEMFKNAPLTISLHDVTVLVEEVRR